MIIIFDLHGVIFDYDAKKINYEVYTLNPGLEILQACANQKDQYGKKRHKIYILSNWGLSGFQKLRDMYPDILELFDGQVISGECGYSKPDQEIFELIINRYQLADKTCIFIDDVAMNIAAAKQFGWIGIHYQDPAHATNLLKELKVF